MDNEPSGCASTTSTRPTGLVALPHRRDRLASALLAAGLLLIALNLRIGVASVGPVLPSIRTSLGLSAASASLLTTIPVLAFGVFAFVTPALTRRVGMNRLLGFVTLALVGGIVMRLPTGAGSMFAGTLVVGASIAIANVLLPAAIKEHFAQRVGVMMGLYSTVLTLGAAVAAGLTVPLTSATGGHWRPALALWAVPALAAFAVWLPRMVRSPGHRSHAHRVDDAPSELGEPSLRALVRDRTALGVTVFMGVQSMGFYATLTWIPTLLQDHGMSDGAAGWLLSYSNLPGIAAALITPTLARRVRPRGLVVVMTVGLLLAAYLGLATVPTGAAYLWLTLLGLGQGASISLSLSLIVWRSPDTRHTAHLSTMAQGFGYLLAALGPVGLGALHSASGGWTVPLVALSLVLIVQLVSGLVAGEDRHVLEPHRRPIGRALADVDHA